MARRRNFSLPDSFPGDQFEFQDEEEKADEEYEVEAILEAKRFNGVGMYRIKWLGYGHEHNSWEPAENLTNCQEKLDKFREEKRKKRLEREASTSASESAPASASASTPSEPISFASSASRQSTTYLRLEKNTPSSSSPSASASSSRRSPPKTLSIPLSRRLGPSNKVTSPIMGSKRYIWPPSDSRSDLPAKRARIEHDDERNGRKLDDIRGKESKSHVISPTDVPIARTFRFEGASTIVRRGNLSDSIQQPPTFLDVFGNARVRRENVTDPASYDEVADNTRDRQEGVADSFVQFSSNDVVNKARDRREKDPNGQAPTFLEVFNMTRDGRENIADPIIQNPSKDSINHTRDRRENVVDPIPQPLTFLDVFNKTRDRRENVADPIPQTSFKNVANKTRDRRESGGDEIVQNPTFLDVFNKRRDRVADPIAEAPSRDVIHPIEQTRSKDVVRDRQNVAHSIQKLPTYNEMAKKARDRRENVAETIAKNPSKDLGNKTRDRQEMVGDTTVRNPSNDLATYAKDRRENVVDPKLQPLSGNVKDRRGNGADPIVETPSRDVLKKSGDRQVNGVDPVVQIRSKDGVDRTRDRRENVAHSVQQIPTYNEVVKKARERLENVADTIVQSSSKDMLNKTRGRPESITDRIGQTSSKDMVNKDRREKVADTSVQARSKDYNTRDPKDNIANTVVRTPSRDVLNMTRDRRESGADPILQAPPNNVAVRTGDRRDNVADPILQASSKDVVNKTRDRRENVAGPVVQPPPQGVLNKTGDRRENVADPILQPRSKDLATHAREQRETGADPILKNPSKDVLHKTRDRRDNVADTVVKTPSNDNTRNRRENVSGTILPISSKDKVSHARDRQENHAGLISRPHEKPFKQVNMHGGRKSSLDTQEKIDESFNKILEQIHHIKGGNEQTAGNAEDMDISFHSSTLIPRAPSSSNVIEAAIPPPLPFKPSPTAENAPVTESISTVPALQTPISGFRSRTSMSSLEGPSPNFPNIASILNTVQRAACNTVPLALIASEKESHASASNLSGPPNNQITATPASLTPNASLSAASIAKIRQHWSKLSALPSAGGLVSMQSHGKGELGMYEDAKNSKSGAYRLDPCGHLKSDALSAFVRRCRPTSSEEPICTIDGNTVWWLGQICKHGRKCRHFAHVGLIPLNKLVDGRYRRHLETVEALCVRYVIPADRAFRHVKISSDADEMLALAAYATIPGTTGVVETNPELEKWAKWLESKNIAGVVPLVSATLFIFSSNYPALRSSLDRDLRLLRNPILIVALCKDGKVPVEPTYASSDSFLETKYIPAPDISNVDSFRLEFLARYFQIPESFSSAIREKNVAIYSLDPERNQEVEDMINLVKGFKGIPLLCTCKNGIWNEGKIAFYRGEVSHVLAHRNTRKVINDLPGLTRMREYRNPEVPGGQVTFAYFGSDVTAGEFGYNRFYRGGGYVIPTARFLIENPAFIANFISFAEMKELQNQAPWHLSIHPDVVRTLKSAATTTSDTIISPDELVLALVLIAQRKPTIAKNLDRTRHELVATSESGQELLPNLLLNAARLHLLYHKCIRHFVVLVSTEERAQYYGNDYKGASIMTERTFQNVFGMMATNTE